jgi:hypothetical protein
MRTKALLCAAALAAGAVTSMAQSNVYSLNVVGYINQTLAGSSAGQYQMIANQLNTTNNTIGSLIPVAPDFTTLLKWNGTGFDSTTYASFAGGWDHPTFTLNPGEGAFINSPNPWTNTFVGEVLQGSLTNAYPAGYSIRASQIPLAGTLTALQLPASQLSDTDNVLQWNVATQSYISYTLLGGTWFGGTLSEPTLAIGESMFLFPAKAGNWVQNFTVQ